MDVQSTARVAVQPHTDPHKLPDPRNLAHDLFPLREHPLYGSVEDFTSCQYLAPPTLAAFTNDCSYGQGVTGLEICPACFFNTSGTTSRSKKIPYSDADLERQRLHESIALRRLGLGPGDAVISLGAPLPSISGWAIVNGSKATGAEVLNSSQLDFEEALTDTNRLRASVVIGTPRVVREIGLAIQEEYGSLHKFLPNLHTAVIFGDVLPDALRADIKSIWGFRQVYSLYGTVEADVVATESTTQQGRMDPLLERLVIEIIPEPELQKEWRDPDYHPRAYDIRAVPDGTLGEILITDPARDVLPLLRYRIGDVVQVHAAESDMERPLMTVLGRSANTVRLDGVPVYEMQITNALESALGERLADWQLVQLQRSGAGQYRLCVQPNPGAQIKVTDWQTIQAHLKLQRPALAALQLDRLVQFEVVEAISHGELKGDAKAKRIQLLG